MDTYKIERLFHLLMERLDRHEKILDEINIVALFIKERVQTLT